MSMTQSVVSSGDQSEDHSANARALSLITLEETQRRRLISASLFGSFLNFGLLALLIAAHGFDIETYHLGSPAGQGLLTATCYMIILTTALVLALKRIAVAFVARISVFLIALTVIYDVAMAGGLHSVNGPILLVLPALASLILRPRDMLGLALLNTVGIIIIAVLQYQGDILPTAVLTGGTFLASMAFVLIIGSFAASGMAFVTVHTHETSETQLRALLRQSDELTLKLDKERTRFKDFSDVASDWLFEVNRVGICTYSAGRLMASFEGGSQRLIGLHQSDIVQDKNPLDNALHAAAHARAPLDMVHVVSCLEGEPVFHLSLSAKAIYAEDGSYMGYRGVAENITEKLKTDEQMKHMARHDSLTGLVNRNVISQELENLDPAQDKVLATLIDLDGFKAVNDTYGHDVGDQLLQEVARRLTACVGPDAIVARLGGDEFLILGRDMQQAANLGPQILTTLGNQFSLDELDLNISASVGHAAFPEHARNGNQLLVKADLALYTAKNSGRDACFTFEASMELRLKQRLRIEERLRKAIQNEALSVHYQPQYSLHNGRLIGFEALARWTDEELGVVPPDEFISIAEECGLISDLGTLVLRAACQDAMFWPVRQPSDAPLILSVNLSPKQLLRSTILAEVKAILTDTGFPASRLEFEITESVLIADKEKASSVMDAFCDLGISIAIDDFGTGYSSLGYLSALPFNRLKIDRSFIANLHDPSVARITQAIIQLGNSLGITVIAEGVEMEEQRALLEEMNCNEVQGHLFSEPVQASETGPLIITDHARSGHQTASDKKPASLGQEHKRHTG